MRMKISLALLAALGCTAALANPSVAGRSGIRPVPRFPKAKSRPCSNSRCSTSMATASSVAAKSALFPPLSAAFDDADTNRDNLVSYAEVQVFAVKYRAERQRKRAAQADVASRNQVVKP
jgi:hypothetical protein